MSRHDHTYSYYAWLDSNSPIKYEFLDGDIMPLLCTPEHDALSANLISALTDAVADSCSVYGRDLGVHVESARVTTHPDAVVICGALRDPVALFEVTSDASEKYDTITKLEYYRTIPTLREYVIVSHREPQITLHSRGIEGTWLTAVARNGDSVELPSLDARLSVDAIYRVTSAD